MRSNQVLLSAPTRKLRQVLARPRDALKTQSSLIDAATAEFAAHGYRGARLDEIAKSADANIRMIYHYFGNKEGLYLAVLEKAYGELRDHEKTLRIDDLPPVEAIEQLFRFTFFYFDGNRQLISILTCENQQNAQFLSRSSRVPDLSSPLLVSIGKVLRRGAREKLLRPDLDALQLYVTMVALSYIHISNAPTLSYIFQADISAPQWRDQRFDHALAMLMSYVGADIARVTSPDSHVSLKARRRVASIKPVAP